MVWLCSNEVCPDKTKLEQGSNCPSCGAPARQFAFIQSISHLNAKSRHGPRNEPPKEALLKPEMTDDDLRRLVREDLDALSSSKSSSHLWSSLEDLLDENSDESPEEQLLKTVIGQNKILIRQNELILRALSRTSALATEALH